MIAQEDKVFAGKKGCHLTPKILSNQIWITGYFGQPLTYPDFTIFSSDFLCISLKAFIHTNWSCESKVMALFLLEISTTPPV
jgi:hypothetical protein